MSKRQMSIVLAVVILSAGATTSFAAPVWSDDFEDGVINPALWTYGGTDGSEANIGFGGGVYQWDHYEEGGRLRTRLFGPSTGITYGGAAWIQTKYDFNDGNDYTINFTWGAQLNASHIDGYMIAVTNGSNPNPIANYENPTMIWQVDNADNTRLYWTLSTAQDPPQDQGQENLPETDWSIFFDASENSASLYKGPNLTGDLERIVPLDPSAPWRVRFLHTDANSGGFPGTDNYLDLYSFTPEPATAGLFLMGGLALLRRRRF